VSLDTGALAPLRGVSRSWEEGNLRSASDEYSSEYPTNWELEAKPVSLTWLVAPILERRAHAAASCAVRRGVTLKMRTRRYSYSRLQYGGERTRRYWNSFETFNRVEARLRIFDRDRPGRHRRGGCRRAGAMVGTVPPAVVYSRGRSSAKGAQTESVFTGIDLARSKKNFVRRSAWRLGPPARDFVERRDCWEATCLDAASAALLPCHPRG